MFKRFAFAFGVWLVSSTAGAGVIGPGVWVPTPSPNPDLYTSEDCDWLRPLGRTCHVFELVPAGTEMFTSGFEFDEMPTLIKIFGITDLVDAPGLSSSDGHSLQYDTGFGGFVVDSRDGTHMLVFRQETADYIDIYVAVEDLIKPIIKDYDDAIYYARVTFPPPPCTTCGSEEQNPPPETVPEPAFYLLFGCSVLAAGYRLRPRRATC